MAQQRQIDEHGDACDGEREGAAGDRPPASRGHRYGKRQQREREQRQDDAERADSVGGAQRAHGEALASEVQQPRIDVGRDLARDVRCERAQGGDDDSSGIGQAERHVAAAIEQQAVPLIGREPDQPAKLLRGDDRVDYRRDDRPRGDQIGGALVDHLHDDLARDHAPHRLVTERGDGAIGEGVRVQQLLAHVQASPADDHRCGGDDRERDAER